MQRRYTNMRTKSDGMVRTLDYLQRWDKYRVWWTARGPQEEPIEERITPIHILQNAMYPATFTVNSPAIWRHDSRPQQYSDRDLLPFRTHIRPPRTLTRLPTNTTSEQDR